MFAAAGDGELGAGAPRTTWPDLGTALLLVNVLDPEAVVVGGGLGSAHSAYWSSAVTWARQYMYSDTARAIPIRHASWALTPGSSARR